MLSPDRRSLYTDALRPPPGFEFSEAIAATYSLDLDTLLTIPLHLALFSTEGGAEELLKDGVGLLEALRRTTGRLSIYAEGGRVRAPRSPHPLYGMLEEAVVQAAAPAADGAFHPKFWLLRFEDRKAGNDRLRLLILSRNITEDRCWDLILTLEGTPDARERPENRGFANLVRILPALSLGETVARKREQARRLAELALLTEWEVPDGTEQLQFHTLGLGAAKGWLPGPSDKLAVISPFVSERALEALCRTTKVPLVLVSRPEELAGVRPGILSRFRDVMVLNDRAEVEDGEESEVASGSEFPAWGLHAKAYIVERGTQTHLYLGSANATSAALVRGVNVELLVELIGKQSRLGSVEELMGPEGLGSVLLNYVPPDDAEPEDAEQEQAQEALEQARRALARAGLRTVFREGQDGWVARVEARGPIDLPALSSAKIWLITRQPETAVSAQEILAGGAAEISAVPLSSLTSFIAFELTSEVAEQRIRFVLRPDSVDFPSVERDAALTRSVIENREGFLRYVLLLLAEFDEGREVLGNRAGGAWRMGDEWVAQADLPLFEEMTRAFCRDPDRLKVIARLLADLGTDSDGDVIPPEFVGLWQVFEAAMQKGGKSRS